MLNFGRSPQRFSGRDGSRALRLESLEQRHMLSATSGAQADSLGAQTSAAFVSSAALEAGPTLNPIANQATVAGAAVSFTLTANRPDGQDVAFVVVDAASFVPPSNVDVTIDQLTGEVTLTPHAGVTGAVQLRAGVRNAASSDVEGNYDFETFTLSIDRPSLSPVANLTTPTETPISFTLTSTDPLDAGLAYEIVDPITLGPPAQVTVSINQATGQATLTPEAGFVGGINLLARVRSSDSPDDAENYSTQAFTLSVSSSVSLAQPNNIEVPGEKTVLVPLTGRDSAGEPLEYTFSSSNPNVQLALVSPGGTSLVLNVAGTDKSGQPFSGKLTLKLFEELAPGTTARIKALASTGFYDGKPFHRVIDGFMAQGGANSNVKIRDEFSSLLTFTSPGLLAMANAGRDTGDAQFFITALSDAGETTPIGPGDMPQHLNFRHAVFGQLVDGFDVFQKLITTSVTVQGSEVSKPVNPITITSAQVVVDAQNAVLRVTPLEGFTGSATITVTAENNSGSTAERTFTATAIDDEEPAPPFLGLVSNRTTTAGEPVTFTLTSTDLAGQGVQYSVVDPTTLATPANATVSINQQTGEVTLTPKAGFTGTIDLLARVRAASADDDPDNYDTEAFTLTVTAATSTKPALGSVNNQTTTAGNPVTLTLTSTNQGTGGVQYSVVDPTSLGQPANVTVVVNQNTGQVTLTPASGFTGTVSLLARVRNSSAPDQADSYSTQPFTLTVNAVSTTNPTIGAVANQTTTAGTPATFTLTATNPSGGALDYSIVDATTGGAPANVTVSVNDSTGQATLTPTAGFTGTINLRARVRLASAPDTAASYSEQSFTLTVTAAGAPAAPTALAMVASAGGGPFDGNGYATVMPTLTLSAPTGTTVQIKRGNAVIATATETASGSGQYRATLPAGSLAVGSNALTAVARNATAASADSTALTITYAPDYAGGVYTVPGAPGEAQSLAFTWTSKSASYNNEFGYVVVSSGDGVISGVSPDQPGYAQAALSSAGRNVIFTKGQGAGAARTITLTAGQSVVFYMIQNNTTGSFLAKNPTNAARGNNNSSAPLAFFSVQAANPDDRRHVQIIADSTTGFAQYNWEDLFSLGDGDFNDAAITVRTASHTFASPGALRVPGGSGNVNLAAMLLAGNQPSPLGDLGAYFVDDLNGAIGSLRPGDPGYAAAALAAANRVVLYGAGAAGASQATVAAGKYVAFYGITSGTTADFLAANSTNAASGSPMAFFSFDDANPDDVNHFRWVSPGNQRADADLIQLHVMDDRGGDEGDFDAYSLNLRFTA